MTTTPTIRSVLCVDDNRQFADNLRDLVRTTGRAAEAVYEGRRAVQAAADRHGRGRAFDLVLLDLRMPGEDAVRVLRQLLGESPGVCVIVLTGYGSVAAAVECMAAGAAGMIEKKYPFDEMMKLVGVQFAQHAETLRLRRVELDAVREKAEREKAEDRLALFADITSVVAHEIHNRQPIVRAAADLAKEDMREAGLLRGGLPAYFAAGKEAAEYILHLIKRLQTFSKTREMKLAPVLLATVVGRGVTAAKSYSAHQQVVQAATVNTKGVPTDLMVMADDGLLSAAVEFLVQNALDEFSAAGRPWEVVLTAEIEGEWVRLEVADTGPGFSPDHLKWVEGIRHGYHRPPPGATKKSGKDSLGIGLTSACRIVAAGGGRYTVANRPDRGAVVTFFLPRYTSPGDS